MVDVYSKAKKDQLFLISTIVDIFISDMNSPRIIRLERDATDRPWGFRLQGSIVLRCVFFLYIYLLHLGGSEFPVPLTIQLVSVGTRKKVC